MQSNEVGGSYHMEKEGLLRVIQFLQLHGMNIDVLVTDRHRQISKWIRENHPEITHYYDVWHVAKGKEIVTMSSSLVVLSHCTCMLWTCDHHDFTIPMYWEICDHHHKGMFIVDSDHITPAHEIHLIFRFPFCRFSQETRIISQAKGL